MNVTPILSSKQSAMELPPPVAAPLLDLPPLAGRSMRADVVGMNFRNRELVEALNPRSEISVARNKIATKSRLEKHQVAVAPTIAVIEQARDIPKVYDELCRSGRAFVVKPARSAQGRGILLCRRATDDGIQTLSGKVLAGHELLFHFHQILHGEFSFGRPDDAILIEQLLETDTNWILPDLCGAPDLRIVICQDQFLLAMARLPTAASDGRANLHCGAVGIGIDLKTGLTRGGVHRDRPIDCHPDTGAILANRPIQDFDICLELAKRCNRAFKLGFIGIDLMRDINLGPVVLEVNARPGLGLQIANRVGLLSHPVAASSL